METAAHDPEQAWFWTDEWQDGERRASEDIAAGRITRHEDADAMFGCLNGPTA
jgi:hypothetical protein